MGIYYIPGQTRQREIITRMLIVDASASLNGGTAIGDATGDTAGFFGKALASRQANIADPASDVTDCASTCASILDILETFGLMST